MHDGQKWKPPRCPVTDKRTNRIGCIHMMEYYSALKRKETRTCTTAQMHLEDIMLSDTSQSQRTTHDSIPGCSPLPCRELPQLGASVTECPTPFPRPVALLPRPVPSPADLTGHHLPREPLLASRSGHVALSPSHAHPCPNVCDVRVCFLWRSLCSHGNVGVTPPLLPWLCELSDPSRGPGDLSSG